MCIASEPEEDINDNNLSKTLGRSGVVGLRLLTLGFYRPGFPAVAEAL